MGKFEKLIEKLRNLNSDNAWTFDDAVYILETSKFKKVGGKGSHQVYQNNATQKTVVLARHGKKVKSGYIRSIRKALDNEQ
mgnify:FL=1